MLLRLTISLLIAILPQVIMAQESGPYGYYLDAIRFSQTLTNVSARIQALGGSNVALGADITSISANPAGLGMYNRSDVSITPGFNYSINNTTLGNSDVNNQNIYGTLDNIGIVINNTKDGIGGWLGGSFGFSVNKINDFNNEFKYAAYSNENSMVDYFIESANGSSANNFPSLSDATDITTLAYYTYLIGPWNVVVATYPDDEYFSDITVDGKRPNLRQEETVKTSGSQFQWSLSYGGNLADVLYVGFGIGVVSLDYTAQKSYMESSFDYSASIEPTYDPINQIYLEEELNIKGIGINSTFGLILRPVAFFRLGASITTPTVYSLDDTYNASLAADWNNFFYVDIVGGDTVLNYMQGSTAEIVSQYSLNTPLKASVGASIFIGKLGFITADIEYIDYSNAFLKSDDFSMASDNNFIKENFTSTLNLKTGVEIRMDVLRFRAGYALDNVPTTADLNYKSSNQRISGGAGLHLDAFYADFTIVKSQIKSTYSPYVLADNAQPNVEVRTNNFKGLLTLGYKF